jgi:glycosyltransferase involved in cell wall biosynthesis
MRPPFPTSEVKSVRNSRRSTVEVSETSRRRRIRSTDRPPAALDILVVTSEAPPVVSGISRSVDRLVTGLRARGHHVDVLSSAEIPRLVLGEWRFSSLAFRWLSVARRIRRYDVVNLHGPVPTMSDVFLLLFRLLGWTRRPVVYTHHSALEIKGVRWACAVYNRLHRVLSGRATSIVATSKYYAETMSQNEGPPIRVVPWGVDVRPVPYRRRSGLEPLRVLFVGQMRPYKGVEFLLPAVAGRTDIEVTLVGSGPDKRAYQELAAELGGDNVQFSGRLSDQELHAAYDRSDVIVLPSVTRAEAFGLVVLEGMAASCVPVVTDLPGVRDLVSRTGVVVPPRDVHALRDALAGLAADRSRLDYLSRAARRRAETLGWDACVDSYEAALVDAVARAADPAVAVPEPVDPWLVVVPCVPEQRDPEQFDPEQFDPEQPRPQHDERQLAS